MRLAQIILPEYDNDGNTVNNAHSYIQRTLAEAFGGYTSLRSQGGWVDPKSGRLHTEPGKVYQVAMDDTPVNTALLRSIARTAGRLAHQLAMFVVYPSHEVEIIDLDIDDGVNFYDPSASAPRFMHGLEDIKRLNENAVSADIAKAIANIDAEELARATKYVKLLRTGYGLMHDERNDVADMLIAAYGIVED